MKNNYHVPAALYFCKRQKTGMSAFQWQLFRFWINGFFQGIKRLFLPRTPL